MGSHCFQQSAGDAVLPFGRLPGFGGAGEENGEGSIPAIHPALFGFAGFQINFRGVGFNLHEASPLPPFRQPGIVPDITADAASRLPEAATYVGIQRMRADRFLITADAGEDGLALHFGDFHGIIPVKLSLSKYASFRGPPFDRLRVTYFILDFPPSTTCPIGWRRYSH